MHPPTHTFVRAFGAAGPGQHEFARAQAVACHDARKQVDQAISFAVAKLHDNARVQEDELAAVVTH
jgi:hypothetical protein